MADSILRLKVESQEYDNKLKQATQGLTRYADECRKIGGTLEVVEKETLDYVRALGQMDTTSRTATGKLAEMKKTFTELSVVYKNMTDEEKNSPFGKALATSLDQLKGRIGESKVQLDDINKSINGGGGLTGALDSLSDKFGMSVQSLAGWGTALAAGKAALDVAKDAFFASEETVDEWGRVMDSSKSLYEGFLTSLNTGDISGFLSRIDSIVQAARAAYDALDNLGTFNAFNQINTQRTRTGLTEAMAGYRMGETSKGDVQKAAKAYQEELRTRQKLEQEAYSQAVRKVAAERGVPWGNLEQALSGSYGNYEKLKGVMPSGKRTVYQAAGQFGGTLSYEVPMAVTAEEKMGEALRKLNDTELKELQALGAQAQRTGEEIAQVDKQLARTLNGKQPGTSGGSTGGGGRRSAGSSKSSPTYAADSIAAQEKLVQDLTSSWRNASGELRSGYIPQIVEAEAKLKEMKDQQTLLKEQAQGKLLGGDLMTSGLANESVSMSDFENQINAMIENLKINPIEIPIEATEKDIASITMAARTTADVVGSIGDAFNAIEDPAAKVMGTVMQAIASVALGYAQATVQATSMGPWAWVAFTATGLATMLSTISAIHSATGYATGGMVEGNTYSGDQIPAMLNAGEVVLNKAQQGNLASQLEGGGMRNMNISGRIRGTDIILSVDRTLSLEGKQLLTWGR